jgi:hypothetical protein
VLAWIKLLDSCLGGLPVYRLSGHGVLLVLRYWWVVASWPVDDVVASALAICLAGLSTEQVLGWRSVSANKVGCPFQARA